MEDRSTKLVRIDITSYEKIKRIADETNVPMTEVLAQAVHWFTRQCKNDKAVNAAKDKVFGENTRLRKWYETRQNHPDSEVPKSLKNDPITL